MSGIVDNKLIIVTGFGPFGVHQINASWEAVKLLPDEVNGYKISKHEIPVSYKDVEEKIPMLWTTLNPKLVIHVGVSGEARKITIEKKANRTGYQQLDCYGKTHPTGNVCSLEEGDECIPTGINVKYICEKLNNEDGLHKYTSSGNAGRYLCEFTYYTSLRQNREKCIFIHVPPIGSPYSVQELSEGILRIINCALEPDCFCT